MIVLREENNLLKEQMQKELQLLGLSSITQPIFYNCKYGIRFEIGVGDIYEKGINHCNKYIEKALQRAITIYNNGIKTPSLLMWETYPQSEEDKKYFVNLFFERIIPIFPQEVFSQVIDVNDETIKLTQLFWDLKKSIIPIDKVFREIILGDIGGLSEFVSSIYVFDVENHVILHLYDDRGLDIVAYDKATLIPIYHKLNKWILDYDRKQIDKMFINS